MKINFKSKRVITGLLTVVLLGFGIADPRVGIIAAEVVCGAAVKCDG